MDFSRAGYVHALPDAFRAPGAIFLQIPRKNAPAFKKHRNPRGFSVFSCAAGLVPHLEQYATFVDEYDVKVWAPRPEGTTIVAFFTRGYDNKDRP